MATALEINKQKTMKQAEGPKAVPIPQRTIPPDPISPNEARAEEKTEEKKQVKEGKKPEPKKILVKKDEAIARGLNLHISKKHGMYIGSFIKGKPIDHAIEYLQEVIKNKKPLPFKGEIPHRKGMHSGRYPVNASIAFINLLKALKGNAITNGLNIEKTVISEASANWASRPQKSAGRRSKRTHILLKAREIQQKAKEGGV